MEVNESNRSHGIRKLGCAEKKFPLHKIIDQSTSTVYINMRTRVGWNFLAFPHTIISECAIQMSSITRSTNSTRHVISPGSCPVCCGPSWQYVRHWGNARAIHAPFEQLNSASFGTANYPIPPATAGVESKSKWIIGFEWNNETMAK